MNTEIIHIRIHKDTKKKVQSLARKMGLNLSTVIKGYLQEFIRTKKFNIDWAEQEPTEHLLQMLQDSNEDIKKGAVVAFNNWEEEKKYLEGKVLKLDSKAYLEKLLSIKTVWSDADVKKWKKGRQEAEEKLKKMWGEE